MHRYLTEFIGAFFLSLVFNATVHFNLGTIAALALGGVLIGLTVAGSRITGAHYNPAVSLGALIAGRLSFMEFVYYQGFQIIGAIIGAGIGGFLLNVEHQTVEPLTNLQGLPVVMVEFLGTFLWVYVWLSASQHFGGERKGNHAWAVGFTLMAAYLAFYKISGGACNPGLAISLVVDGTIKFEKAWMHALGEFVGAVSAASLFIAVQRQIEDEEAEMKGREVDGYRMVGRSYED